MLAEQCVPAETPGGTFADCAECGTKLIKGGDSRWRPTGISTAPCTFGAGHLAQHIRKPAAPTVNFDNSLSS
jgi:hypothetical protein